MYTMSESFRCKEEVLIIFGFFSRHDVDIESEDGSSDDEDDDDDDISDDDSKSRFTNSARPRDETIEDKKLRKQAVKDAKAEKRKNKMPKHLKKRKEKQGTKKK